MKKLLDLVAPLNRSLKKKHHLPQEVLQVDIW